jgi:predicted transposase YdaD
LRYYFAVTEANPAEVNELVKDIHPEAEKLMATIAEQLSQRAREEGREEGREQGREEGQRATLLKLLRLRFQELPDDALARVEAATSEQLDLWAERILTANTLDEVLAD